MSNVQHSHPRRARKARRTAQAIAILGFLGILFGMWYLGMSHTFGGGWPIAALPLGSTAILLAAIWYFSYMEHLEPENYEHDKQVPTE